VGGAATLVSALCAVLMFGLSLASWPAKRAGQEGKANREMRALNVSALRYLYQVDIWAARRGLELPDRPRELTVEGATERAQEEPSPGMDEVVQLFERFSGGKR
jgi:hypothetical protein